MNPDNEINALNDVYETLKGLGNEQIKRILIWIKDKFDLEKHPHLKAVEREAALSPGPEPLPEAPPVEAAEPAAAPVKKRRGRPPGKAKATAEPIKKRRGRRPAKKEPVVEEPVTQPTELPVPQGFLKYDNFEELLLFSTANTNTAKVLLAAAYLQVTKNLKEFYSFDISTLFKNIGEDISQPSTSLNNLMSKTPPLVTQTGTQGPGLKPRRKFRVTEEGLRTAGDYIKE
ncbi:MAG: hypothetical protein PVH61_39995 [Candidatus Aminicenantes bacterium]|jgi:hypothetical protein